jgi:quinolinate synthase
MSSVHSVTAPKGLTAQAALSPALLPDLAYTPEVARDTAHLYERVSRVIPPIEWPGFAPYIHAINELKRSRNAVVLAHNYMTPEIFHCVADVVGDSLQLAREASKTDAEIIVQGGVHFMAETSKLLNPDKMVLIPDLRAGCSLAASITGADVRALREAYPGVPVVTYVNTSAEVKAESDICCTSSNAVKVVESLSAKRVIMIPDEYLAKWVQTQTDVEIITWQGHCEVHERFTGDELRAYREADPGVKIIAHPGVRARRARGGRLHRLDLGHDQVGQGSSALEGAARDRVLDERQRRRRGAECRVRAALQSLPAHETHHAAEDP